MDTRALRRHLAVTVLSSSMMLGACSSSQGMSQGASDTGDHGGHPLVNSDAPAFSLPTVNGKGTFSLKANVGKVVIVDFWATWCEPCKKSFPKLQSLYSRYKSRGLIVIGVSQDDELKALSEFARTYGADFPIGWDKGKEIVQRYDPKNMPTSFVIDRNGLVRFIHLGYHDGDENELEAQIKTLL